MRLFSIPAMLIGITLAILFFKVYGMLTRPSVPRPIAVIVDQFAPGVEIGGKVSDARHYVAAMTYVPHLGYVGIPGSRPTNLPNNYYVKFTQVRLLLDESARVQANPNPAKTRVDAVEVVSGERGASTEISTAFMGLFRRPPREGCIRTAVEGKVRDVRIWPTPNERGGVAMITEHDQSNGARGPTITSVLAFVGKFDGGRTLRADYTDASCTLVLQGA